MTTPSIPGKLPPSLYRYFWDVDPQTINPQKLPQYVIQRLLDKGKSEAVRFVLDHFPRDLIIETLKKRRGFSPRSANFWALYFGIPKEEVVCLNGEYLHKRVRLWPY